MVCAQCSLAAAGVPAFLIFGDAVLRSIAATAPASVAALGAISGIGPEKLDRFGADVLGLCRSTGSATESLGSTPPPKGAAPPARLPQPTVVPKRGAVIQETLHVPGRNLGALATPKLPKPDLETKPVDPELHARLRDWRDEQAAQTGLPTFFILSETALRKGAATSPTTLEELGSVANLSTEKLARYGAEMIALCSSASATL